MNVFQPTKHTYNVNDRTIFRPTIDISFYMSTDYYVAYMLYDLLLHRCGIYRRNKMECPFSIRLCSQFVALRTILGFFVHLQVPCLCIGICMDGDGDDDDDGFVWMVKMHREHERQMQREAHIFNRVSPFFDIASFTTYILMHQTHAHTLTFIHSLSFSSLQRAFTLFSVSVSLLLLRSSFPCEFWHWIVYGAVAFIEKTHMLLCVARVMVVRLTHVNSQISIRKTNAISLCLYVHSLARSYRSAVADMV